MNAVAVWAPDAKRVRLVTRDDDTETVHDMSRVSDGWWRGPDVPTGVNYGYLLNDAIEPRPDPASRWQPYGVHGLSRAYDDEAYEWGDAEWRGRALEGGLVYELHVGTFTPGATFDSAVERLDHLVDLGVTHVEVLPVNAFNGTWNWGYDGVGWYAVHEPYGGPDGLKRFVDACHVRGLAVVLDVVYNHLGPSGNYLPEFGPYLTSGRNTWGDLVNVEHPEVRRFIIENALMWLRDFHIDGLRLDAVHALHDSSPVHILADLSAVVDALAAELDRPLTLIAESDLNDPVMVTPRPDGYGLAAQWDDDVHHALHSNLTGERQGYYGDFGELSALAKVLTSVFLHDGTFSTFREQTWGKPVDREHTEGWRFVVCLQNHDQVGNRAVGDRLPELISERMLRVGAVLLLTSPFTPMLWMGEEWAASTRWPFFTSHPEPELGEATAKGRLAEFEGHGWDVSSMIDPQDPAAYREAILNWVEIDEPRHRDMLAVYRGLIALRAAQPELRDSNLAAVQVDYDEDERWLVVHRGTLRVAANLSTVSRDIHFGDGHDDARILFVTDTPDAESVTEMDGPTLRLPAESAAIISLG